MGRNAYSRKVIEIERLRNRLYSEVNGQRKLLCSSDIYEVSRRLDKLIVKYMSSRKNN